MRRNVKGKPHQRPVATSIICWLLAGGALLLLPGAAAAAPVGVTEERLPGDGYGAAPGAEGNRPEIGENQPVPADGTVVRPSGTHLAAPRLPDRRAAAAFRPLAYTVTEGDSLWLIAQTYETDVPTLIALNPEAASTIIHPGDVLQVIPGFRGVAYTVRQGETLSGIAATYGLDVSEIITANGLTSGDRLQVGQSLLLPGATSRPERMMVASRNAEPRRNAQATVKPAASLQWVWPITGGLHSSEFGGRWGGFHSGLDIAVPAGTPVAAAAGGTVTFAGWDGGYGYAVIIDHGGGLQTRYAHASKLLVSEGQTVSQGEHVILVGSTGNSTGPHLHFEVLVDGVPQNPRLYLP